MQAIKPWNVHFSSIRNFKWSVTLLKVSNRKVTATILLFWYVQPGVRMWITTSESIMHYFFISWDHQHLQTKPQGFLQCTGIGLMSCVFPLMWTRGSFMFLRCHPKNIKWHLKPWTQVKPHVLYSGICTKYKIILQNMAVIRLALQGFRFNLSFPSTAVSKDKSLLHTFPLV